MAEHGTPGGPSRPEKQLAVMLTAAAHEAWFHWCEERGVTVTAVIEAAGQGLAAGATFVDEPELIRRARQIDRERRSRRRRPGGAPSGT